MVACPIIEFTILRWLLDAKEKVASPVRDVLAGTPIEFGIHLPIPGLKPHECLAKRLELGFFELGQHLSLEILPAV